MNDTHTHTNLDYWQHELNQIFVLLKIAICKFPLDEDVDVLVRTALNKVSTVHSQVGGAINAKKSMETNSESSEL